MKKIYTALTSVFNNDYRLNTEAMDAIIKYNIDVMKVDGLYINGSTGEFPMLSFAMKKELLTYVYQKAHKQVDLIAQIGSTSIVETLELGKIAKEIGYTKVSCISPFYFKADFEAYYAYYQKVANALKLDFYPYYIPALTGVTFSNQEIKKLLELAYVKGIKFSDTNVQKLHEVRIENPDKEIYWGWDEMMISGLVANVDGFIGSTYALNGLNARKLVKAFENNDQALTNKLIKHNLKVIDLMVKNNLMESIKYAIINYYQLKTTYTNLLPTKALTSEQQKVAISIIKKTDFN